MIVPRRNFEQALALARDLEDASLESDALTNLALFLLAINEPERAGEILRRQVARARAKGDPYEEKLALDNIGAVYVKLGDLPSGCPRPRHPANPDKPSSTARKVFVVAFMAFSSGINRSSPACQCVWDVKSRQAALTRFAWPMLPRSLDRRRPR
jgi:tetratricopeptide (TPR) repeat protein